jgi:hypothetical protein
MMKINQGQAPIQQQAIREGSKETVSAGKTIEGTIVSVNGKEVVLDVGGRLQTLTNLSEQAFKINQQARFVIISSENGKTLVRPESQTNPDSQVSMPTFVGQETQETKSRVDLLLNLNIPVTPESYDKVKQMTAEVKVLLNELMNANETARVLDSSTSLEQPIKSLILALSQLEASKVDSTTVGPQPKTEMQDMQPINQTQPLDQAQPLNQNTTNSVPTESNAADQADIMKTMLQDTAKTQIQTLIQTLKSEGMTNSEIKTLITSHEAPLPEGISDRDKSLLAVLKEQNHQNQLPNNILEDIINDKQSPPLPLPFSAQVLLSQFDTTQQGLLLKNNMILSLKNVMMTQALSQNSFSLGDHFASLSRLIKKLPTELQMAVLDVIQNEKPEEALNRIQQMMRQSDIDDGLKSAISKDIVFVKEASQITKQFGDQVFVMQMPIQFEDETRHVNFYVKSRKQEKDDEDFTLLIALKTHHIDEVRCIVEKRQNKIGLHFKLADDMIKDLFEENISVLDEALKALDIKTYQVDFAVNQLSLPALMIEEPVPSQALDLKV